MHRPLHATVLMFFVVSLAAYSAEAQSPATSDVRYAVEDNNRLFLAGDGERYVKDLHLYLHCASSVEQIAEDGSRKTEHIDVGPACAEYQKQAAIHGVEVPNLRNASTPYHVRYDRQKLSYLGDYAVDARRRVKFWLRDTWQGKGGARAKACRWHIEGIVGSPERVSPACDPIVVDLMLSGSDDGAEMSWRGRVRLEVETRDGDIEPIEAHPVVRDLLIMAMGDSFTSGEGNPERNKSTSPAEWLDMRCDRSAFSYPVMVAAQLALLDPRHSVTLVHLACSGATTNQGVLGRYRGLLNKWRYGLRSLRTQHDWRAIRAWLAANREIPAQVTQATELLKLPGRFSRRRPDLLLMSIGVNDLGFTGLLKHLATTECDDSCFEMLRQRRVARDDDCEKPEPLALPFTCLEKRLSAVRLKIDQEIRPKQVYLMEYFNPVRDARYQICTEDSVAQKRSLFDGMSPLVRRLAGIELTRKEFEFAEAEFLVPLTQVLARVAMAPGWAVPPALRVHEEQAGARKGRGFCGSPSWYHTYKESHEREGVVPFTLMTSAGTLHPNGFGHFYASLRVLTLLHKEKALAGHNINLLNDNSFDPVANGTHRKGQSEGFAHFVHNMDEPIDTYYRF